MKRFYLGAAMTIGLAFLFFAVTRSEYVGAQGQGGPPPMPQGHPVDPNAKPGTPGVFTDFKGEAPGNVHHITAADLPDPYATKFAAVFSRPVPRGDMWPQAPAGFKVELYAE